MKLNIFVFTVFILSAPLFGQGLDGGKSFLKGTRPFTVGKGTIGLGIFNEYSNSDIDDRYNGEYINTTRLALNYGLTENFDLKLYFPYYVDVIDQYRYGSGDLNLGVKWSPDFINFSTWKNGVQLYGTLATGFKEDPAANSYPYLRPFSAKEFSYSISWLSEIKYSRFNFLLNLGYYHLPADDTSSISYNTLYQDQILHRIGEGYQGLNEDKTYGTSCPQFPFVIGVNYNVFNNFSVYSEYAGAMLMSKSGGINDPVSLSTGIIWTPRSSVSFNVAMDFDLFETVPERTIIAGISLAKDLFAPPVLVEEEYPITPETIRRIAIIGFKDNPGKGFAHYLTDKLKEKIIYSGDFQLVEEELLENVLKETKIPQKELRKNSSLSIIGRALNVDYVITGEVLEQSFETGQTAGIRGVIGKSGIINDNRVLLKVIIPETGEYVYNKVLPIQSDKSSGLYFFGFNNKNPRYFTSINEKKILLKQSANKGVEDILRVFYEQFYHLGGEKLDDHIKKKNFFN